MRREIKAGWLRIGSHLVLYDHDDKDTTWSVRYVETEGDDIHLWLRNVETQQESTLALGMLSPVIVE